MVVCLCNSLILSRLDRRLHVTVHIDNANPLDKLFRKDRPLLESEAERCEITGKAVMPGLLECCEVTGKKVLPSELERSAVSGKNSLKKLHILIHL